MRQVIVALVVVLGGLYPGTSLDRTHVFIADACRPDKTPPVPLAYPRQFTD
jgi:hypothetical protein